MHVRVVFTLSVDLSVSDFFVVQTTVHCALRIPVFDGTRDWDKRQPAIPKRQIKRQCLNYQIFMRRKPPYYRWIMVNDGNDSKTTLFYCRFLAPICPKTTVSFKDNPTVEEPSEHCCPVLSPGRPGPGCQAKLM